MLLKVSWFPGPINCHGREGAIVSRIHDCKSSWKIPYRGRSRSSIDIKQSSAKGKRGILTTRTIVYLLTQARWKLPSIHERSHGCEAGQISLCLFLCFLLLCFFEIFFKIMLESYQDTTKIQFKLMKTCQPSVSTVETESCRIRSNNEFQQQYSRGRVACSSGAGRDARSSGGTRTQWKLIPAECGESVTIGAAHASIYSEERDEN